MSDPARIASIEALDAFRSDLIRYVEKTRSALDDMTAQVRRTRTWLDADRTDHWTREIKNRTKRLEQAEQELYSANLTNPQASNALQKMAVKRAKSSLDEAAEKLRALRKWRLHYENRTGPLVRMLDPMFHQVSNRIPAAIHLLGETVKTLQDYAGTISPPKPSAAPDVTPDTTPPAPTP